MNRLCVLAVEGQKQRGVVVDAKLRNASWRKKDRADTKAVTKVEWSLRRQTKCRTAGPNKKTQNSTCSIMSGLIIRTCRIWCLLVCVKFYISSDRKITGLNYPECCFADLFLILYSECACTGQVHMHRSVMRHGIKRTRNRYCTYWRPCAFHAPRPYIHR